MPLKLRTTNYNLKLKLTVIMKNLHLLMVNLTILTQYFMTATILTVLISLFRNVYAIQRKMMDMNNRHVSNNVFSL